MAGKKKKFQVRISSDHCKGCDLCVEFCPKGVLAMTEGKLNARGVPFAEVIEQAACSGCQCCVQVCPDARIEIVEITD